MGISGLTSFIDKNPHVLHSHKLRDCPVVIDGNNFYHYLYYANHVNCSLGGDYDAYRRGIISTFSALKKCNVCPYVVLDGGYTVDDRKLSTSLKRACMRNHLVNVMARFGRGQVLPILAYETFLQTLTELGIHHVTCQFEADIEIAVLANKLNCPVISNDSDFCIFDLTAGFLPLDYIDFRPLSPDQASEVDTAPTPPYLHCQLYRVDDFINSFEGLSRPMLPIFASLLGNDYVKASNFDAFYRRLQTPKAVSKKFKLSQRLSKIIGVIHWFHHHNKDWTSFLDEIIKCLHPRSRNLFFASINSYKNIDKFNGCDLFEFFTSGKDGNFLPVACPGFSGFNGAVFPDWFLKAVCRGDITPSTMNAAVLHRVIFLCQVEDLSQVSSYQNSQCIRKVLYGILFKSDLFVNEKLCGHRNIKDDRSNSIESISQTQIVEEEIITSQTESEDCGSEEEKGDSEEDFDEEVQTLISQASQSKFWKKQTQLEEYTRVQRQIVRKYVDPTIGINGIPLPSLSDLEYMAVEDRLDIVLSALEVPKAFVCKFSQDISLFSSCLLTWLRNADPKVTEHHLDCVLLCLFYLSIHDKLSCQLYKSRGFFVEGKDEKSSHNLVEAFNDCDTDVHETIINFQRTLKKVPRRQLQTVHTDLARYCKKFTHKSTMDSSIPHAFAQLQACLLDASNLNKLMRLPLSNIRPAFLLNCTFMYNAFCDLISRPRPDMFVGILLASGSPIHQLFLDFKLIIKEFLPQDSSVFAEVPQRHSKKSRKRRATKVRPSDQAQRETIESDESADEDKELTIVPGFDLSNKFSSLLDLDG